MIESLIKTLKNSSNIVFFGGAGVSTASNIPDFRSSNGLFNQQLNRILAPEQMVSRTFFDRYPEEFFKFYKSKLVYPEARPNNCHIALAKLETIGKLKAIVTQNIDGLHQMAGSKKVLELHGSIHRNYCRKCHAFYDLKYILQAEDVPRCVHCNGVIKPDVVLYDEALDDEVVFNSIRAIEQADTLIIGGTSLVVYPAAGLIDYFHGSNMVLINKSSTSADERANLVIHDSIDHVLFDAVERLSGENNH